MDSADVQSWLHEALHRHALLQEGVTSPSHSIPLLSRTNAETSECSAEHGTEFAAAYACEYVRATSVKTNLKHSVYVPMVHWSLCARLSLLWHLNCC